MPLGVFSVPMDRLRANILRDKDVYFCVSDRAPHHEAEADQQHPHTARSAIVPDHDGEDAFWVPQYTSQPNVFSSHKKLHEQQRLYTHKRLLSPTKGLRATTSPSCGQGEGSPRKGSPWRAAPWNSSARGPRRPDLAVDSRRGFLRRLSDGSRRNSKHSLSAEAAADPILEKDAIQQELYSIVHGALGNEGKPVPLNETGSPTSGSPSVRRGSVYSRQLPRLNVTVRSKVLPQLQQEYEDALRRETARKTHGAAACALTSRVPAQRHGTAPHRSSDDPNLTEKEYKRVRSKEIFNRRHEVVNSLTSLVYEPRKVRYAEVEEEEMKHMTVPMRKKWWTAPPPGQQGGEGCTEGVKPKIMSDQSTANSTVVASGAETPLRPNLFAVASVSKSIRDRAGAVRAVYHPKPPPPLPTPKAEELCDPMSDDDCEVNEDCFGLLKCSDNIAASVKAVGERVNQHPAVGALNNKWGTTRL